jgi:polyisoprenyl-phosphate glycosyltransferase
MSREPIMSADRSLTLSIVAPCYNEADGIVEFCRRAIAAAQAVAGNSFELLLVDDGSRDATWDKLSELAEMQKEIVAIKLMRNHGHQLAATAGLANSRGEFVLLIDADLQDPPELVSDMMAMMNEGLDVVYGQRRERKGESWFKLATAKAFYRILPWLAKTDIPKDTGDFRLMRRRVVDILLSMPEQDRFLRGMVSWIGGRQAPILYERDPRYAGTTGYPLTKMLRLAIDAITGFSTRPLRIATWCGVFSAAAAVGLLLYTIARWMAGDTVVGWSSLMVVITGFSAVQLLTLGILGEYLGRLVQQSKSRPLYLVDEIVSDGLSRTVSHTRIDRLSDRYAVVPGDRELLS